MMRPVKIAIGSDHAGFALKAFLKKALTREGHRLIDLGTYSRKSCDYPDYAFKVALAVLGKKTRRGIVVCGSGVGAAIAANKVPGIRAALCHDLYSAHQSVEHDDANVLCLGSQIVGGKVALEISRLWLNARFSGAPRHKRRLQKIAQAEDLAPGDK